MDQVRPLPTRSPREHAQRRLVDLSSSNPIRWRPCADPVQKRDPGERITQKGLTDRGPLQKGGQRSACDVPTIFVAVGTLLPSLVELPADLVALPTLRIRACARD